MNLDSIHRLIEETQIFQMQQSSIKARCDVVAPASYPKDTCPSCLQLYGLQSHATHNFSAPSFTTNKWDICEELCLQELKEVKARAAQMEKTMRWWSDCTANWREKWSKVRAERNSAREEGRQLRIKLEMTMKELSALKKKQRLSLQKEVIEAQVTQKLELPSFEEVVYNHRDQSQVHSKMCESARECLVKMQFSAEENTNSKEEGVVIDPLRLNGETNPTPYCLELFQNDGSKICAPTSGQSINLPLQNGVTEVLALQVHLDAFQKILRKEREMRAALEKEVERLESALSLWKWKYEELKKSKPPSVKKFDILHNQHDNETEGVSGNMKEESKSQKRKDRIICELRAELERLQVENTLEWDKRELLETEKQGLERENRRLKVQVKEMEELLNTKNRLSANSQGLDFKTSQIELQEKNKELLGLQHDYKKLSRQYQAKTAAVTHTDTRVSQNEAEVKRLRYRVEELKLGLHQKEDELDDSLNQIHKRHRTLDEQTEPNEHLEIQLRHLQSQ